MAEEESGEEDFDHDGVNAAAAGTPGDEAAFEYLREADGDDGELLVNFRDGRQKRESKQEQEAERVNPAEFCSRMWFEHRRLCCSI